MLNKLFPAYARRLMLFSLLWNCCVYYGGRVLTAPMRHFDLTTAFDAAFPFLPWTVSIYFLAFVFWAFNFCLVGSGDKEAAFRFYLSDYIARTAALVMFIAYPTTMTRVEISGGGFWNGLMRLLYRLDEPNMIFPSFHCLNSTMAVLALRGERRVGRRYKLFSVTAALAICLSTLTTHQHVLADVFAGIALAIVSYVVTGDKELFSRYYALCNRVRG